MSGNRLFTDEELREMGRRTLDVAQEAIEQGDKQKAKELVQRMYKEFNHLHDGYMFWATGLLTYIYQNYGIESVEKAERFAHTIEGKTVFKPLKRDGLALTHNQSGQGISRTSSAHYHRGRRREGCRHHEALRIRGEDYRAGRLRSRFSQGGRTPPHHLGHERLSDLLRTLSGHGDAGF